MSGELEIVAADGTRSTVSIGRSAHVLPALGVQILPIEDGVRIEPTSAGALLAIEGEELFCKQLSVGEFVVIDAVRLRLLRATETAHDDAPIAPSQPVRSARSGSRRPAAGRRSGGENVPKAGARFRSRRRTSWAPASALTAAVLLIVIFIVRQLQDSTWPHSPQHFVELAQAQFENRKLERALETLAFALRDATGEVHEQAVALDAKIRARMLENASAQQVLVADQEHGLLQSFEARYLQSVERPAARECVRLCDVWLDKHREACRVHPQGKPLVRAVEDLRERYVLAAALGSPESAADVVFAARSMLRFQWRDYVGALARLDAFLQRNPGSGEVLEERRTMLEQGEEWLQTRLERLDRTLERGDRGKAETDLDRLERWVAIPQWQARIAERRARWRAGG